MKIMTPFQFLVGASLILGLLRAESVTLPLWPAGAVPGSKGTNDADIPTLTTYPAARSSQAQPAMVILPGGGYGGLAGHEGRDYALFLNREGVHGFVVKYRLGSQGYRHPSMLQDAARAVRWVRAHAAEWGVDPDRIGIMGSSAGGHLASTLLTHHDGGDTQSSDLVERMSSRPNLGVLCYAVISMGPFSHAGSRRNLLGENPSAELIEDLSNETGSAPQLRRFSSGHCGMTRQCPSKTPWPSPPPVGGTRFLSNYTSTTENLTESDSVPSLPPSRTLTCGPRTYWLG